MAKDRAKDSRRVPSLGIGEPISHVRLANRTNYGLMGKSGTKLDKFGQTDKNRKSTSEDRQEERQKKNNFLREGGRLPVVKIDSNK